MEAAGLGIRGNNLFPQEFFGAVISSAPFATGLRDGSARERAGFPGADVRGRTFPAPVGSDYAGEVRGFRSGSGFGREVVEGIFVCHAKTSASGMRPANCRSGKIYLFFKGI